MKGCRFERNRGDAYSPISFSIKDFENFEGLELKLIDFGFANINLKNDLEDFVGTPYYIAPEIIAEEGYEGGTVDLWSAGVVLYAMLYGNVPFKGADMKELHKQILEADY